MATAVFRPIMVSQQHQQSQQMHAAQMQLQQQHLHFQLQQQQQQQQQLPQSATKRPIAPASAQNPRTIIPLHSSNALNQQPSRVPLLPRTPSSCSSASSSSSSSSSRSSISSRCSSTTTSPTSGKSTVSKLPFHPHPCAPYPLQPASVQRRNARERNRVKQVNNGFTNLRQHIPTDVIGLLTEGAVVGRGASKKLSKVDTLKVAVEYIRRLQGMLDSTDNLAATPATKAEADCEMDADSSDSSSSSSSASSQSSQSPERSNFFAGSPPLVPMPVDNPATSPKSPTESCFSQRSATAATTDLFDGQSLLSADYYTGNSAALSPVPSYISVASSGQRSADSCSSVYGALTVSMSGQHLMAPQLPYKTEPDAEVYQLGDEDLLDCISYWQNQ